MSSQLQMISLLPPSPPQVYSISLWAPWKELTSATKWPEGASNYHTLVGPILCWIWHFCAVVHHVRWTRAAVTRNQTQGSLRFEPQMFPLPSYDPQPSHDPEEQAVTIIWIQGPRLATSYEHRATDVPYKLLYIPNILEYKPGLLFPSRPWRPSIKTRPVFNWDQRL